MIKKRHHIIPKFYLKGFCGSSISGKPCLWAYEKGKETIRISTPVSEGCQKRYYSIRPSSIRGGDTDAIENLLAEIEGTAANITQKILSHQELNKDEKLSFAFFLSGMLVRTDNYRKNFEAITPELMKSEIRRGVTDINRINNIMAENVGRADVGQTPSEVQKMLFDADFEITLKGHDMCLQHMTEINYELAAVFFLMTWSFVESLSDLKYVTSDNPVYYFSPADDRGKFRCGLADKNVEVYFPLTKEMALVCSWGKFHQGYLGPPDKNFIKDFNRKIIMSAERYVWASFDDDAINRLVQKHKNSAPKMLIENGRGGWTR